MRAEVGCVVTGVVLGVEVEGAMGKGSAMRGLGLLVLVAIAAAEGGERFVRGSRVEIQGLTQVMELNGLAGTVVAFDGQKQRYEVSISEPLV